MVCCTPPTYMVCCTPPTYMVCCTLPLSQINPNKKTLLEAEVEKFLRHEGKAVIFKCSSKSCEYIVYIPRYMCGSPR